MRTLALTASLLLALGCSSSNEFDLGMEGEENPPPVEGPAPVKTCKETQRVYTGFGGKNLTASRLEAPIGQERERLKGFEVLVDDYKRLTGLTPSILAESGPTFGAPPARWYSEPKPEAVALYQAYRVAFEACLTLTAKDAKYAADPVAASAATECTQLERKVWSRTPNPDEIQACVDVAVVDTVEETKAGAGKIKTDPRRRWAYTCAMVLTSPNFLTY